MPTPTSAEDSLLTNASLLVRLRNLDDADSWSQFYQTYERAVRGLARKRGLTEAEAEEVAQEVFKRIAETIHTFDRAPRPGSFRSWLYQLARWRSEDKLRERGRIPVQPMDESTGSTSPRPIHRLKSPDDIEQQLETEARQQLMRAALERLQRKVSPRDLQLFQLLVIDDWPVAKVAQFFHVSSTLVYVIRHRVGRQLKAELDRIQKHLGALRENGARPAAE